MGNSKAGLELGVDRASEQRTVLFDKTKEKRFRLLGMVNCEKINI